MSSLEQQTPFVTIGSLFQMLLCRYINDVSGLSQKQSFGKNWAISFAAAPDGRPVPRRKDLQRDGRNYIVLRSGNYRPPILSCLPCVGTHFTLGVDFINSRNQVGAGAVDAGVLTARPLALVV